MTQDKTQTKRRSFTGVVVSDVSDKTIVVRVDRTVLHAKYGKRYQQGKRYQVHDENNEFHVGDVVEFEESKPYSSTKKWRVISKVRKV